MEIGDVVTYIDDWKGERPWYLYDISDDGLCTIVIMRDGKIIDDRGRRNASIINLDISKIRKL